MGGFVFPTAGGAALPSNNYTGWAQYTDTQYTEASPFTIAADTKVNLPNSGVKLAPQMPPDITDFYDSTTQKILGRSGDGFSIGVEIGLVPQSVAVSLVTVSIDIGGAIGEIYPHYQILDKGVGVYHPLYYQPDVYSAATWEANGGVVKIIANGPVEAYNIRYVFHRLHKAR